MSYKKEVVVLSGVRTAIGGYGGSLKDFAPTQLAAMVVKEAVNRAKIDPNQVGHCIFGNVIHTDRKDMYLSRVAAVNAGLSIETPSLTLNRLCGSGLQAIVSAAQLIRLGDVTSAVAGGAECMSRGQYWMPSLRWGQRMSDAQVVDAMVGALTDPFDDCHMGVTAENIAQKWGISRADQDTLAAESHRRASHATQEGRFKSQILPIEIKERKATRLFENDEHFRVETTVESLGKLKPIFNKEGSVTAGNASGINDAAAAIVMMEAETAKNQGFIPMARLVDYSFAGVEPKYMGIGPVPAVKALLAKTGLTINDIDVFEVNEAFAAQALAVCRDLDLPMDKTNINGSGISLGHPIGATGCIVTIKCLYELQRTGGRYGLVTMCIGGGQGIAALFERI
jgi:acetyl-CoA C-acetyltransferase